MVAHSQGLAPSIPLGLPSVGANGSPVRRHPRVRRLDRPSYRLEIQHRRHVYLSGPPSTLDTTAAEVQQMRTLSLVSFLILLVAVNVNAQCDPALVVPSDGTIVATPIVISQVD